MTPLSLIPATINHLLAGEPWAQRKLNAHGGKVVCIDTGVIAIRLQVTADGMLASAAQDALANVTIHVNLSDLPLIAQNREHAFTYVKVAGDADFANTISQVTQNLRWEAEEDLSHLVGDIAATRIVAGVKSLTGRIRSGHQKLAENVAEYLLEEQPMLVRPLATNEFTGAVTTLRHDLERLTKRIERLEKGYAQ